MAYGNFKNLTRRTASDKILRDKAFNIAKNQKYDGYQRELASVVYNFFYKKTSGNGFENENMSIQCPSDLATGQVAEDLHKPIIRKFTKRELQSPFIDNIWSADLADMQLISKFNQGFIFLLCVIDICSKYAWVMPLKDKKSTTITNAFQKILKESNYKPNKTWVDKGSEVKGEIPSITNLATTAELNAKINEVKGKIPNITNLTTNTALTAVENKKPNVSNLEEKSDSNTKISEIEKTISEFIKLTAENFVLQDEHKQI